MDIQKVFLSDRISELRRETEHYRQDSTTQKLDSEKKARFSSFVAYGGFFMTLISHVFRKHSLPVACTGGLVGISGHHFGNCFQGEVNRYRLRRDRFSTLNKRVIELSSKVEKEPQNLKTYQDQLDTLEREISSSHFWDLHPKD